jgi:tRNA A-37 threonylcarbamoyl transferase component Bud32
MTDFASSPTQMAPGSTDPADPYVGKLIGDRYRLLQRIGEGGMGAVYRAEHTLMKKTVACKLLHGELGHVEEAVRRFEREAQSASRLSHPNIIAVTDFGRTGSGELYLTMEYVPGLPLAEVMDRARESGGRLSLPRALGIVRQMLSALAHAHSQGVVHRDLKPANVMLTRAPDGQGEDHVKILDFGIAKMSQELAEGEQPLTQAAMVFGTPSYMSPEQATAQEVDARADIYACGVILYELVCGRKPFVASDLVKVMAMQVTAPVPRFAEAAPDARLPAALEVVVMRALEKERERRYQSADEFRAALDGLEMAAVPQALAAEAVNRARVLIAHGRPLLAELRARYARLPFKVRRWSPAAGVAAVVLALVAVPSLCARPVSVATPPPPPKRVAAVLENPLRRVEDALAAARLTEARAMLLQLVSSHPAEARVRYLLGNLEFAEKKRGAGLEAYAEALRLDPGLRGDAALLVNVRSVLDDKDKNLAGDALRLLIDGIGAPAAREIAARASSDPRAEVRAAARKACDSVGCAAEVDRVRSYALDLSQAKTCDEKREAVAALAATKDPRALAPLKKARGVRGALGGLLGGGNDCVRKDIEAALKELGG